MNRFMIFVAAMFLMLAACENPTDVRDEAVGESPTSPEAEGVGPTDTLGNERAGADDAPRQGVQQPTQQQPAEQQVAQGPAQLKVSEHAELGNFVTDGRGMALYMFMADEKGQSSTCNDACARDWPPLTTQGDVQTPTEIDSSLVSTITRVDGQQQVTLNGWPLYTFARDQAPGDVTGHDVEGHGAEWYLMSPAGEIIRKEREMTQR